MASPKVFFMHLRQPGPDDPRTDPLYEFGSFGCTKCHCTNLFHPRHAEDLAGSRLAFVQGGDGGSRLVFLTPSITVRVWADNCEACWTPPEMPFKYTEAPVLVANDGSSDFPLVLQLARTTNCPSLQSGLSSQLRSRSRPLSAELARHVVSVYERHRKDKGHSAIAANYTEALPYVTNTDGNRRATYRWLIGELRAEIDGEPRTLTGHTAGALTRSRSQCRPSRSGRARRHASD
jgi:hypothetical protein